MSQPSARAILAAIMLSPDTTTVGGDEGQGPEDPNVANAVCDWLDAVYAADARGTLDELLKTRDLLGATESVR